MVNDTYSDIISNAGGIYKYTIYLHNPHFTAPVRSPVRTPRFSAQNNPITKFYNARADSAPPATPHAPMSLTSQHGAMAPTLMIRETVVLAFSTKKAKTCRYKGHSTPRRCGVQTYNAELYCVRVYEMNIIGTDWQSVYFCFRKKYRRFSRPGITSFFLNLVLCVTID